MLPALGINDSSPGLMTVAASSRPWTHPQHQRSGEVGSELVAGTRTSCPIKLRACPRRKAFSRAAGWLAGKIMKGRSFGIVGNLVIGVIGAVLLLFLWQKFGPRHLGKPNSMDITATYIERAFLDLGDSVNRQE
jgi:uncharacterized membrane protein YeaQ/YmgE (transglycosylase-associated protein family)